MFSRDQLLVVGSDGSLIDIFDISCRRFRYRKFRRGNIQRAYITKYHKVKKIAIKTEKKRLSEYQKLWEETDNVKV